MIWRQMAVAVHHGQRLVAQQLGYRAQRHAAHDEPRHEGVPKVMDPQALDPSAPAGRLEGLLDRRTADASAVIVGRPCWREEDRTVPVCQACQRSRARAYIRESNCIISLSHISLGEILQMESVAQNKASPK